MRDALQINYDRMVWSNRRSNMKKIFAILPVLFACTAIHAQQPKDNSHRIAIQELQIEPGPGGYSHITGSAVNTTAAVLRTAVVNFNLYDDQGAVVFSTGTYVHHLEPWGKWRFRVPSPVPFSSAKVTAVNIYD